MKCPNCGAEYDGKKCLFCESSFEPIEEDYGVPCPKCGSTDVKFYRELAGSTSYKKNSRVRYKTSGVCQNCGHTWVTDKDAVVEKHGCLWWLLAICFWPVSLSVWFWKTDKVKLDKKKKAIILAAVWAVLILISTINNAIKSDPARNVGSYVWPTTGIGAELPKPQSEVGETYSDGEESFEADIYKTSQKEYEKYVSACAEVGFSENPSNAGNSYKASKEENLELEISYYPDSKEMSIRLVDQSVRQARMEEEEKEAQKRAEEEAKQKEEEKKNEEQEAQEETSESDAASESKTETSESSDTPQGVSPEFKEMMDNYEEFFDEYIAFMKKYEKSDGTDLSLMLDYASFLQQYSETMEKMEAVEDQEMTDEEAAYYLEVTTRINKKLLEVL